MPLFLIREYDSRIISFISVAPAQPRPMRLHLRFREGLKPGQCLVFILLMMSLFFCDSHQGNKAFKNPNPINLNPIQRSHHASKHRLFQTVQVSTCLYLSLIILALALDCHASTTESPQNENWMSELRADIGYRPLRSICIPGTHDSGTFQITRKSGFGPDAPLRPLLNRFHKRNPSFDIKGFMAPIARTQNFDFTAQLLAGIRFLDLRVARQVRACEQPLTIVHSLWSITLEEGLQQISGFLQDHPNEVILLDFHKLHRFKDQDHEEFMQLLGQYIGATRLAENAMGMDVSLNDMNSAGKQVMVFYQDFESVIREDHPARRYLWSKTRLKHGWANAQNYPQLKTKLNQFVKEHNELLRSSRDEDAMFTSIQNILTPTPLSLARCSRRKNQERAANEAVPTCPSSILNWSPCLNERFMDELLSLTQGKWKHDNLNIVMLDFFEMG